MFSYCFVYADFYLFVMQVYCNDSDNMITKIVNYDLTSLSLLNNKKENIILKQAF